MLKLYNIFESVILEQQLNTSKPFDGLGLRDVITINANGTELPFEVIGTTNNQVEFEILLPKSKMLVLLIKVMRVNQHQ